MQFGTTFDKSFRSLSENDSISELLGFLCARVRHRIGRFDCVSAEIYARTRVPESASENRITTQ